MLSIACMLSESKCATSLACSGKSVCLRVCVCVCLCVYACMWLYAWVCVCLRVCVLACVCLYACVCACLRVCVRALVRVYGLSVCMHTHIYACMLIFLIILRIEEVPVLANARATIRLSVLDLINAKLVKVGAKVM